MSNKTNSCHVSWLCCCCVCRHSTCNQSDQLELIFSGSDEVLNSRNCPTNAKMHNELSLAERDVPVLNRMLTQYSFKSASSCTISTCPCQSSSSLHNLAYVRFLESFFYFLLKAPPPFFRGGTII